MFFSCMHIYIYKSSKIRINKKYPGCANLRLGPVFITARSKDFFVLQGAWNNAEMFTKILDVDGDPELPHNSTIYLLVSIPTVTDLANIMLMRFLSNGANMQKTIPPTKLIEN